MRFIGSKTDLLDDIEKVVDENIGNNAETFIDLFAGTGVVGERFKGKYTIKSNDFLYFSYCIQRAIIESNKVPEFKKLKEIGIKDPLSYLENTNYKSKDNFFIRNNYSPYNECERMYFTIENASRIDFIRQEINRWRNKNYINEDEYYYLLAVLITSVPKVANITGTYGAYLKKWDKRALNKLKLYPISIINNNRVNKAFNEDSNTLIKKIEGDILYLDPPYNNRQYSSNYHVLETIAKYDYPEIRGVTGLRPNTNTRSEYSMRSKVHNAFEELLDNAKVQHIILSYSNEGLLNKEEIENMLLKVGKKETLKIYEIPYRKYKSVYKQKKNNLKEYIFYIESKKNNEIIKPKLKKKPIQLSVFEKKKEKIKSPLNYIGGKYRLLDQILPLFPKEINNFVDLFAGGLNVGINVNANKIIANDMNNFVIELLETFNEVELEEILQHINMRIREYDLSKTNEEGFLEFREYYNKTKNPLDLYTLVCYSFNYQFRFNNSLEYNNPFGRNRSQFSNNMEKRLIQFVTRLQNTNIEFQNNYFENVELDYLSNRDLVYCDPPYLITTGSYNDGNRGFKDWTEEEDIKLMNLLDDLDDRSIKFALSNVFEHKGLKNKRLEEWAKKYNVNYLNADYSNSSYNSKKGNSIEVLITNY